MKFLDKLYESNYFGIGLFAVIAFLVVTFLVVLFFGKKDEKKRQMAEENNVVKTTNSDDLFKETSHVTPVEVPVTPEPVAPVMPTMPVAEAPVQETQNVFQSIPVQESLQPVTPITIPEEPIKPVTPINLDNSNEYVENVRMEEPVSIPPVTPIINETVAPVIPEVVEPVRLEPVRYDISSEPKVMEPIKINVPEEPIKVEPLIKEEEKPIITPVIEEPASVSVQPVVNNGYEKPEIVVNNSFVQPEPVVKAENEEIKVPSIDFDALAKSISQELDELEKSSNNARHEEVKVTPMSEVAPRQTNQFSSVYVNEPVQRVAPTPIDLPKKIDLPTMKEEEIKPENYNI